MLHEYYPQQFPTMANNGSISRRRGASVSQRGDSPLPPLDIQSIQMPSNPQNALALKTAALTSTKSLYQTCSILRKRLRNVEDFTPFLEQPSTAQPLDVVSHMCNVFRLGSPLIHLYNLLIPSFCDPQSPLFADKTRPNAIVYNFPPFMNSPEGIRNWAKRPENAKPCKKYIASFCVAMQRRREEGRWHGEIWAVHELWGQTSGDDMDAYDSTGLMKVLCTVDSILDNLPDSVISPLSPQTPHTASSSQQYSARGHLSRMSYDLPFSMGGNGPGAGAVAKMAATMNGGVHIEAQEPPSAEEMSRCTSSAEANAFKSVEELVSSEKSYVNELEILVRCSTQMLENQLVSTETNHMIFSNLSKILDFHRKFLIKLETEYESISEGGTWAEGRWGRPFIASEPDFDCYGPYCANYLDAIQLVNREMPTLLRGQELPSAERPCLHPERELTAFMIKPIQRITKYGLLLDAILHSTAKHDYPYRAELADGAAAVRRIAKTTNEVTDFRAKQATVRELDARVEDWKGHEVYKFGDLWLDDYFTVVKADIPRDYHIFLFEKMMLCCKEVVPERISKKNSKNSSMLRKDKTASKSGPPEKQKLALKGRIFVSNLLRATLISPDPSDPNNTPRILLAWNVPHKSGNGWPEDVEDSFIMNGKTEDTMKRWAEKLMELAVIERAKQEEKAESARKSGRYSADRRYDQSSFPPPTPASEAPPFAFPPSSRGYYGGLEEDDDESGYRSGRTTPSIGSGSTYIPYQSGPSRRVQSQQAMPPTERPDLRARAMTEDQFGPSITQWRSQQPTPSMPPPMPRLNSAMSALTTMSNSSETSFDNTRPRYRRQESQSRLGRAEELDEVSPVMEYPRYGPPRGMSRAPSQGTPSVPYPHPPPFRNRSASSPNVYQQPKIQTAPPVPMSAANPYEAAFSHSAGALAASSSSNQVRGTAYFAKRMSGSGGKRSSGESHSTETSETSSQQSPATPFSSIPGDMRGATPVSRQNSQDAVLPTGGPTILVKVRYLDGHFLIGVPPDIIFPTLLQKIQKKIRYSHPAYVPDTIQLKWIDADEDEITLKCDADIEAMFGECRDSGSNTVDLLVR